MKASFICVLLTIVAACGAVPLLENDPELTAGYFEGDILLDDQRNGVRDTTYRWPNRIVYYRISNDFDLKHRYHILQGMRNIEKETCIRFRRASLFRRAYVRITGHPGGCYANVGYLNRVQRINLEIAPIGTNCFRIGTVMHELLHALGFFHMQSTYDRDEYVRIAAENVRNGYLSNFRKYNLNTVIDYGVEYDYASVMHYPPYAFSANGERTIIALKNDETVNLMGQRVELTQKDIRKLNLMYNCYRNVNEHPN